MGILELIPGCIKKDEKAIKLLYEAIAPKIMAICVRYAPSKFEANDIFQEAFVHLLRKLELYDANQGDFGAWAYRLAVNVSLKYLKKELKFRHEDIEETYDNEGDKKFNADNSLDLDDLRAILNKLPLGQKTIFNLFVVEGYSHKEIAKLLGISESTSKSQLSRAKDTLKKLHSEYYDH